MVSLVPQALLAAGAAIAAQLLLPKPKKAQLANDGPTTLSQRGSFIPYLIGTRMVGSMFASADVRRVVKEKVSGGKGGLFGSNKTDVFYEQGWHLLAFPGPARRLLEIQDNGQVIFQGPITPESHPSGSRVNLGKEGAFDIYWGEEDQPVIPNYEALYGISSKWPGLFSIYWADKRLGTSPTWPTLTYVVEVGLNYSLLQESDGYRAASHWPGNEEFAVVEADNGQDRIRIAGNHLSKFRNSILVTVTGNAAADQVLTVQSSEIYSETVAVPGTIKSVLVNTFTDVFFEENLSGFDDTGLLTPHVTGKDSGYNPAHMIAQILFAEYPYGLGKDQDLFDIPSLEALGVLLQNEGMFGSLISREDGSTVLQILAALLQDIGCFVSLNIQTGKYEFVPIRDRGDVVPNFSGDFFLDPEPVTTTVHASKKASKVLYVFEDAELNYRDNPIGGFDNEGEFRSSSYFNAKTVSMALPTDFPVAAKVAERRSQEELGEGSAFKLFMNRGSRLLLPGTQFSTSKTPGRLILMGKKLSLLSSKVELSCIADFISTSESSFENERGGIGGEILPAESPVAFSILEISPYLSEGKVLLGLPTIRAHDQILSHNFWLSLDDVTYRQILQTSVIQTGGVLLDALPEEGDTSLPAGTVRFSELGPDLTSLVLDLSGDSAAWRSGRQVLVIGAEIMFLDGVSASGGDWTLGKLHRARYGSPMEEHVVGKPFFIFEATDLEPIQEPEIVPGATIYIKPQANGSDSIPLSAVPALSSPLVGYGLVPLPPMSLACRRAAGEPLTNTYSTGDSPELSWSYHSMAVAGTGAGLQPAGNAHGVSPVQGEFRIEMLTAGGTLRATYFSAAPSLSYPNASLSSDFTGEPSSFRARVTHVESGYESSSIEILVVKE